ncbi:hypothetical protein GDO78_002915 [Eleutherodactylus coqui]|uniref:Uncharacterized protein n=1 Tax=Eleutherodactylus coqui TaxID=57060 RepID=A0A8J6EWB0_ELECQ|nr:hypothetical protein GDO78_002915 [Eleutherodactylus coqui]
MIRLIKGLLHIEVVHDGGFPMGDLGAYCTLDCRISASLLKNTVAYSKDSRNRKPCYKHSFLGFLPFGKDSRMHCFNYCSSYGYLALGP